MKIFNQLKQLKFIELITKYSYVFLMIPLSLCSFTFIGNILLAISDGTIDEQEFHTLLQQASGAEMIVLAIVIAVLRIKN